ncbi:hypothetical protein QQF64_003207 [Cirrhinus molitorella]|uniref:Uncharacterized protein n=1 Tax=Cirrhinus molitorella TaxID=172907 RepID=A0ABR3MK49_9TELE
MPDRRPWEPISGAPERSAEVMSSSGSALQSRVWVTCLRFLRLVSRNAQALALLAGSHWPIRDAVSDSDSVS